MRKPIFSPGGRGQQTSRTYPMPAPLRGWNAREGKATMGEGDAYQLTNWFPGTASLSIRAGAQDWVTGSGAAIKSLMKYSSALSQKLFAASEAGIFDVSSAGSLGSAVTSCTNGVWSSVNFTNIAGSFLFAVNGVDKPKLYNGTTWTDVDAASSPAITGVTTTTLETAALFKRRIWFTQKNSMNLWYLPIDSVGGAAVSFPVGQIFARGGRVVALANWTIDGGAGVDDHLVIITSEGEVAIYKGTDPASSATFALQGVYFAGKPLGNRCFTPYGGDLIILTESGLLPLTRLLSGTSSNEVTALTSRIDGAFANAVRYYKDNFGWCCVVHPLQNALIVNIPTSNSVSIQFVMNTITGAWCDFQGWSALCMLIYGDNFYFGTNTKVVKGWTGKSDFGNDITATCQQAYSHLGAKGILKQYKLVKPIIEFDYSIRLELGLDVDYDDRTTYNENIIPRGSSAFWDEAEWDEAVWGAETVIEDNWRMVDSKVGYAMALRMRIKTKTSIVRWAATHIIWDRGGIFS